ncbi:MAG: hypothetical protein DLM70_12730 [Chloroflexi bacterium]|nr:MAG: hypothetical protein DLM70_12730 [Chloroflexota bacterium]
MERDSRQQQRARARRSPQRGARRNVNWPIIIGAVVVLAAVGVFAHGVFGSGTSARSSASSSQNPVIDGVHCGATEGTAYHQHAHLTLFDAGKPVTVPRGLGLGLGQTCLYWVHTHDASGVIHMEAPVGLTPALKTVFDIWGEPTQTISRTQFFDHTARPGQTMKVWVNLKPYVGNPAAITLRRHTDITAEIGPPFVPPKTFKFGQL